VAPYINILYRVDRFWVSLPSDVATYLLAILESPHALAAVAIWLVNAFGGDLFVMFVARILSLYFWPRLPAGLQRTLFRVRDYFTPWTEARDRYHEADQESSGTMERIAQLEAKVQEL
jgi:hypothetical protein